MTVAPLSSTIVAVGLIPVAFLFCHAFLSGRKKNRFHSVSAVLGYFMGLKSVCRLYAVPNFRRSSGWLNLKLTPTLDVYFGIHGAVAIVVMALEVIVLAIGLSMLKQKAPNRWHPKLTKISSGSGGLLFFQGEIVYIALYLL